MSNTQINNNEKRMYLTIRENILKLADKDGLVREKARKTLVKIGLPVVDFLSEMETHPKDIARWEAVKALSEINHPITAPLLLNALEDPSEDVRWLAAEGLASLGETGLMAILDFLQAHSRTVLLRNSAHHVLSRLRESLNDPIINELLKIFESSDAELMIPLKIKAFKEEMSKDRSVEKI